LKNTQLISRDHSHSVRDLGFVFDGHILLSQCKTDGNNFVVRTKPTLRFNKPAASSKLERGESLNTYNF